MPSRRLPTGGQVPRNVSSDWSCGTGLDLPTERLPEPLRVTAMLRYFGSYDSYDELAAILGIPIGTVRSRLSEAKLKLSDALLASAGLIDDETRMKARERERFWTRTFRDVARRGESNGFMSHFSPDAASRSAKVTAPVSGSRPTTAAPRKSASSAEWARAGKSMSLVPNATRANWRRRRRPRASPGRRRAHRRPSPWPRPARGPPPPAPRATRRPAARRGARRAPSGG